MERRSYILILRNLLEKGLIAVYRQYYSVFVKLVMTAKSITSSLNKINM